jgi:uncharacterized protein YegL
MSSDFLGTARYEAQGKLVMPFYLLCDMSRSMRDEVEVLREGIEKICDVVSKNFLVYDVAHVCVMTFTDIAEVILPLGPIGEATFPEFGYRDRADYGVAFRRLAEEIARNYRDLVWDGYRVYRPCVYFLTDGEPSDPDWRRTFNETLTPEPMKDAGVKNGYPIFVPFGLRDAQRDILQQLAYPRGRSKWYHAQHDSFSEALTGLLGIIMRSVLNSGNSGAAGEPVLDLPRPDDPDIVVGAA